jgi:hypothetical protein
VSAGLRPHGPSASAASPRRTGGAAHGPARYVPIVPVKSLSVAKSRLEVPPKTRRALAAAFAVDTLSAALGCPGVARTLVVRSDPQIRAAMLLGAGVATREVTSDARLVGGVRTRTGGVPSVGTQERRSRRG